jgi:Bacterial mobilisation protein (MobC)
MHRRKSRIGKSRGGMFRNAMHDCARHDHPNYFEKFLREQLRSVKRIFLKERSEMSFPVPETSQGAKRLPLDPRTHALCEESTIMARPPKREKRDRQLNLKLTTREHAWVCGRAEALRMRLADYARLQLLSDRPRRSDTEASTPHLAPLFLAHLSRIGNNLNQIARRLHQLDLAAPSALEAALEEVRALIRKASGNGA